MPLAHGGPKAFPFPSGSAKAISPVLPTGRVPFVFFPPAIMSMFHVELFSSVTPFFLRSCLWPSAGQRLFLFLWLNQSNQPGLADRAGAFCFFSSSHHVNVPRGTFSVMPLARSGSKVFSSDSAKETCPACPAGKAALYPITSQNPSKCSTWNIFHLSKWQKAGFCALCLFPSPCKCAIITDVALSG